MRQKSINSTSQKQSNLEMFPELTERNSKELTLLLSDSLAKIYQLLEKDEALKVLEVVYSLRRHGLFVNVDPLILSLKTSKGFLQATEAKTLKSYCEKLPTLGYMSANGNCLILLGFYPKIESGFTLSDILEKEVDEKYFLSEKAVSSLIIYNERQEQNNRGFRAEFTKPSQVKQALKVGGGGRQRPNTNIVVGSLEGEGWEKRHEQIRRVHGTDGISPTIPTGMGGGVMTKIEVKAVLTPNRIDKRQNGRRMKENGEDSFTLTGQDIHGVAVKNRIRRLTPIECARLQGFPDDWHKGTSDNQAYRAYGNAVSVPVVKIIMERLFR